MSNVSTDLHRNVDSLTGKYTPAEIVEVSAVLESLFTGKTPKPEDARELVVIAGPAGAGKSRAAYFNELADPDFVRVDVNDNCLCAIPGYRTDLKDKGFEAAYEKWRDASNWISMEANRRAVEKGYNLLFVGTGTSPHAAAFIENAAKEENYHVTVFGYAAPLEKALERNQQRFGYLPQEDREGVSFLLPENHITEKRAPYINVLPTLARLETRGFFQFWNPSDDAEPKLAFTFNRESGLRIADEEAAKDFLCDAGLLNNTEPSGCVRQVIEKKFGLT